MRFLSCCVLIVFFVGITTPTHTFAQQYFFQNYTHAKGLAGNTVNHIFQDKQGYIWFATQGGGVSKFNGQKFTNFGKENGLLCSDVTQIYEDRNQKKWIGTAEGLFSFDGKRFSNFQHYKGLGKKVVYDILVDEENTLWVASLDSGFRYLDGKMFKSISSVTNRSCYTLCQDSSRTVWIGMEHGIAQYTKGKLIDWSAHPLVINHTFFSSYCDRSGNIWMGSIDGVLLKINPVHEIERIKLPKICENDFIGGICEDKRGTICLATSHGVFLYDQKNFKQISTANGLSVNSTQTLLCDDEDNLWVGHFNAGADLLYAQNFSLFSFKYKEENINVTSILPLKNAPYFLLGAKDGLYFFNQTLKENFLKVNSVSTLQDIEVNGLSEDEEGHIWVCATQGVFEIDVNKTNVTLLKTFHQIHNKDLISPMQILHEKNGVHWLATFGSGMFKWQGKNELSFDTQITTQNFLCIYKDCANKIWAGTLDDGLYLFKRDIPSKVELNVKSIWSISENENCNLLIGTAENGILEKMEDTWQDFIPSSGLKQKFILGSLTQNSTTFLIQEDGLVRVQHTPSSKAVDFFKQHDGLNTKGFNHRAIFFQKGVGVWIGSVEGLWLFKDIESEKKITSRQLILENISIAFQDVDWSSTKNEINPISNLPINLKLPYSKNQLTFRVQALTTDNVLYSFVLIGQDKQWTSANPNNEITYSNIAPGHYTFKAISIKEGHQLCDNPISFSFDINPPWWQTWWFKAFCFIGCFVAIFFYIKRRERKLKKENLYLEKVVSERTLKISAQNDKLKQLLDEKEILMKEIHHRVKNNLQMVSSILMLQSSYIKDENTKLIFSEAQGRVNSIGFIHQKLYESDSIENIQLQPFMKDLAYQIIANFAENGSDIKLICDIEELSFPLKKSVSLGIILNELLTNSLKYACKNQETNWIEIFIEKKSSNGNEVLVFSYKDPGKEIENMNFNTATKSLGLKLIQMLCQQLKGKFTYTFQEGNIFLFQFPL